MTRRKNLKASRTPKAQADEGLCQQGPFPVRSQGTPVLLIMSPDGTKVDTLRGYYNGQSRLYFDQIKNSVKLANQQYEKIQKKP